MKGRIATLAAAVVMTLVAGTAWAYWSADPATGSNGAAIATSVDQGATPSASATGSTVTVTWAATTLGTGQAVSGYRIQRYDAGTQAPQAILSACTGTITTTSCAESNVPNGSWKYTVTPLFATNWQGPESAKSATVNVDATAPTNSISLSSVTGGAHLAGTTVYYRGIAAGSLRITNAVADAGSGPASSTTSNLSGTSTGWTHIGSIVSAPIGGPYVSNPFSWAASTGSSPQVTVTGRDVAGNTAATNLIFTTDSTAPTAGTISYADGFASGRSVSVTFASGTDGGSGIATRRLQRAIASLDGMSCGTFGSFTDIGADNPTSPYADGSLGSGCYMYRYVVTDRVGNQHVASSANVVKVGYAGAVAATPGLLSHWRLGEAATALTGTDSFNGSTGTELGGRTADVGGAWVHQAGIAEAVIDAGRIRRNLGFLELSGHTIDYLNAAPPSANYSVEADLDVVSNLASDSVGVIGRLNTANTSFYMARWEQGGLLSSTGTWQLVRYSSGNATTLAALTNQPQPIVGETYRLRLEMSGSSLGLYVNGVLKVSTTDGTLTSAGRAGIMDGADAFSGAKTSTTGIHLDDFQVTPAGYPRAADDKGSNPGDYVNGVTLGAPGALAAGNNTAATFDGVNDHVQMTSPTGLPTGATVRSTELWFKTSSANRQVLFRYGTGAAAQEYGLWINHGGTQMTAWGHSGTNDKIFTMPYAVNDGAWHHVVQTYNGSVITIYIDGVALPAQAASRNTVMDMYGFGIGAVIRPSDGNSGGFFNGSIDEVSFYTTALTPAQVADHHQLGNAAVVDATGPTGGSIDASGLVGTGSRYATSTALSLVLATGTDPSGIAASGHQVRRATATLTNDTCGAFGAYALVSGGTDPASPFANTVTDQACYQYEYVVLDTLGNPTTYTSPQIKVDLTAPAAPSLAFTSFTNTWWSGTGSTVFYRSAASSGSFTATATATDPRSGIASYSYPTLGTNWTSTPGSLGVNTYSWSGAPAAPGTRNVTATNNAGLTSPNAPFTLTADNTAPSAGSVSYAGGSTSGNTVSVSFTTGTDGGSGIGTRLLQRASAPLTGISCGTFGGFSTLANGTNPTSPASDTIAPGSCYRYQYVVADRVGNEHVATSANVTHTALGAHWTFDEGSGFTAADSTGNLNTATLQSGALWTAGRIGANALNLSGASTSFAVRSAPVIDSSKSYTVAAWVRPSLVTGFRTVAAIDGSAISPFYLQMSGGQYQFALRHSDSTSALLTTAPGAAATVGTWAHLAAVHDDDANTVSMYVNGVLTSTVAFNSPWRANGSTTIGRARWNGANVDFFPGALDDVRFYDRPLSASEVSALGPPPPSYVDTVNGTAGLLSYYRLGETVTSADSMSGTTGATLQSRSGETAASWEKLNGFYADAVLTNAGRVRKDASATTAKYQISTSPGGADYTVEADLFVASHLTGDTISLVGRSASTDIDTYYMARYDQSAQLWGLFRVVNNSWTWLGGGNQALAQGSTHRVALDMSGTTIRLLVGGVVVASANDVGGISAPGRAGIIFGGVANSGDNAGYHLDNFRVSPPAADSKGTSQGHFFGGVALGGAGAVPGDSNTSASFDGVDDFASVPRQIADDFSIELWFRSTQGIGTGNQWWSGAGLVDAEVAGAANDFGISLRSDGRVLAGVGSPDTSILSSSGGYNNGAWHHVVLTRTRSSGAMALYINGVAAGTATGSTASLTSPTTISFGRVQGGGHLAGSLDEVAFYDAVLSPATVAAHYAAGQ